MFGYYQPWKSYWVYFEQENHRKSAIVFSKKQIDGRCRLGTQHLTKVYRENIYKEGAEFVSCRSVLETMPA